MIKFSAGRLLGANFTVSKHGEDPAVAERASRSCDQRVIFRHVRNAPYWAGSFIEVFADAFGTTPMFWLNLQLNVDIWRAQQKHKKVRRLASSL